jgi:hypothetical protein
MEVPMLEGEEGKKVYELYSAAFKTPSKEKGLEGRFRALIDYYKEITGEEETNPNVIIHHIVEIYGPQCEKCGKPYRTDKASFCAGCGNKRDMKEIIELVNEFFNELKSILITIKEKINGKSDLICTPFYTPLELRNEIDRFIIELQPANKLILEEILSHFSPGSTFDGHSTANGWSEEYSILAERFHKTYNLLKTNNWFFN